MVLYKTFPRMTKCNFYKYGTAGKPTEQNYLCVLAPNIISEKIFTFLWFWYVVLGIITAVNLFLVVSMAAKSIKIRNFYLNRAAWTRKVL